MAHRQATTDCVAAQARALQNESKYNSEVSLGLIRPARSHLKKS